MLARTKSTFDYSEVPDGCGVASWCPVVGRQCVCERSRRQKLMGEGLLMPESRGCWDGVLEGNTGCHPLRAFPESKGSVATVFSGRGGSWSWLPSIFSVM